MGLTPRCPCPPLQAALMELTGDPDVRIGINLTDNLKVLKFTPRIPTVVMLEVSAVQFPFSTKRCRQLCRPHRARIKCPLFTEVPFFVGLLCGNALKQEQ